MITAFTIWMSVKHKDFNPYDLYVLTFVLDLYIITGILEALT